MGLNLSGFTRGAPGKEGRHGPVPQALDGSGEGSASVGFERAPPIARAHPEAGRTAPFPGEPDVQRPVRLVRRLAETRPRGVRPLPVLGPEEDAHLVARGRHPDEVRAHGSGPPVEGRRIASFDPSRAGEGTGEGEGEAIRHERTLRPECGAGEGIEAGDRGGGAGGAGLPARGHRVALGRSLPGRSGPPQRQDQARPRRPDLDRHHGGDRPHRDETGEIRIEERRAGALRVREVETVKPVADLRPGAAVDSDPAGLGRVQPPVLDPIEHGRGIHGLEHRPRVSSRREIAEELVIEGLPGGAGPALDGGDPRGRARPRRLQDHLHREPLAGGDGQFRFRRAQPRTGDAQTVPPRGNVGEVRA